ncbi:hypothetical protein M413DRAFT_14885 [Hebeloma cylindrosporum]|uniref:Uncharacterized protein n=1 Tax=Hebeloma cylindrosporum TaxID=76867 RepID=A0A0C3BTX7_HEBCY|nr:hypothetical protein M413DRAFT_14885 [Hebeloma cylindrosporum h7]
MASQDVRAKIPELRGGRVVGLGGVQQTLKQLLTCGVSCRASKRRKGKGDHARRQPAVERSSVRNRAGEKARELCTAARFAGSGKLGIEEDSGEDESETNTYISPIEILANRVTYGGNGGSGSGGGGSRFENLITKGLVANKLAVMMINFPPLKFKVNNQAFL